MRSWISVLLTLTIVACNKPKKEEVVDLKTKVTFTLQDVDRSTREWSTTNAYAQRSENAIHLFAINEFGEQLSVLLFDVDTGKLGLNFADDNVVKFKRVKAGVDTTYSNKKSDAANGFLNITGQSPEKSTIAGDFQTRAHFTEFNYVWLLNGTFEDVPYFSVPLTQGELDIMFPLDTAGGGGEEPDPLACPDTISPCVAFYRGNTPYVVTGNNISIQYRENDRLVLKVKYNSFDTLTIGVVPETTFDAQVNYAVGKTLKSKAFIETLSSKFIATTGIAQFEFMTDSVIRGGFELSLKESSQAATAITVSQGLIQNVDVSELMRNVDANNSFSMNTDGFYLDCDTTIATLVDSTTIEIIANSSTTKEAIQIFLPKDVIAIEYNLSNQIRVNHTNFYGVTSKAVSGTLEIINHDKVNKIIEGQINVSTFDFSENRTVNITQGNFKSSY
jgi:hypothetical protein